MVHWNEAIFELVVFTIKGATWQIPRLGTTAGASCRQPTLLL